MNEEQQSAQQLQQSQQEMMIKRLLQSKFSEYGMITSYINKDDLIIDHFYASQDVEAPITIICGKPGVGKDRFLKQTLLYEQNILIDKGIILQAFECKTDLFIDPKASVTDMLYLLLEENERAINLSAGEKIEIAPVFIFKNMAALINNPHYNMISDDFLTSIKDSNIKFTFVMDESEYKLVSNNKLFMRMSNTFKIEEPEGEQLDNLIVDSVEYYESHYKVRVSQSVIDYASKKSDRYIKNIAKPGRIEKLLSTSLALSLKRDAVKLTKSDIDNGLSILTNIDIKTLKDPVKTLGTLLSSRVIGQDVAISRVTKGLQRGLLGLTKNNKPLLSVLAFGTTGVGKTLMAESVAEILNGSKKILRIDMNTMKSEELSAATLIGVPVGYRGYESGGILTEYVIQNPNAVILFDEVEKAAPNVMDILMQIIDTAHVLTPKGDNVDFSNTSLFFTTNAGIKKSEPKVGFGASLEEENNFDLLSDSFKPEILNRFDEVIKLNDLSKDHLKIIANNAIETSLEAAKNNGLKTKLTKEQKDSIIEEATKASTNGRQANKTATKLSDELIIESYI